MLFNIYCINNEHNKRYYIYIFFYYILNYCTLLYLAPPRLEMSHFGIKVSILEPGFFKTAVTRLDLMEENLRDRLDHLPQEVRNSYGPKYFDQCKDVLFLLQRL